MALKNALAELPQGAEPIHHTDQGTQYCCHEYVNWVEGHGLSMSMTERDHCAENALAERMNGILKSEYGLGGRFKTKASARLAVDQAVYLYNTRRAPTPRWVTVPLKRRCFGGLRTDGRKKCGKKNGPGSRHHCAASRLRSGSLTRLRSAAKRRNQPHLSSKENQPP